MALTGAKPSGVIGHRQSALSLNMLRVDVCKGMAVGGLLFYLIYIMLSKNSWAASSTLFTSLVFKYRRIDSHTTTNISHIVFGIAGSANTWKNKRPYIESWWRPNISRGFLWLDRAPKEHLPWPSSSPPFRISQDIKRFHDYNNHAMPFAIRMARVILESFGEDKEDVRWYVMADDDTVLFVDNLVDVLAKYDHNKYYYIGENSECVKSNFDYSFQMAFGGGGYALSFPLAKAMARNLDECLKRYPTLYGSDHIMQACISDFGVPLTHERGSAISSPRCANALPSPSRPCGSNLPSMNRHEAVKLLMEASAVESSRVLQQTVCYHKQTNWSFSISWGYSAQIYEKIHPLSNLERPLQTFIPWKNIGQGTYMFNTRPLSKDPCEMPHMFFFESVEQGGGDQNNVVTTSYVRRSPRRLPVCLLTGNHSADPILKIRVGERRECCDVHVLGKNLTEIAIRSCKEDEVVA
ncbi:hypothetical protein Syun_015847 [Stephania yunnanensis]|uniref:Uncharacterized protein n=1 Tax=Stephania yunnanensis TaxID=152371 RepID=A0AAP0J5G7_9MAGN